MWGPCVYIFRGWERSQIEPVLFDTKAGHLGDLLTVPLASTCLRYQGYAEKEDVLEKED